MSELERLAAEAVALAGGDHSCRLLGHAWRHVGGAHCGCEEWFASCSVPVHEATAARLGNWRSRRLLLETYVHPAGDAEIVEAHFGRKAKGGK